MLNILLLTSLLADSTPPRPMFYFLQIEEGSLAADRIPVALAALPQTQDVSKTCPCKETELPVSCWRLRVELVETVRGIGASLAMDSLTCSIWQEESSYARRFWSVDEALSALPSMVETISAPFKN